ncbi:MAG TPA: DUF1801 domain-containing protein [Candidatus Saccharimonadales bacterium]|nr:DUF1801 domain-containing protein [Candidatus Saccharimonadales bacterium]
MKNYSAKDVDEYIASSGVETHPKLEELRKVIKSTIPKIEEGISWGVPFYKYYGILAGIAAHTNHVGIWFPTAPLESIDREMLEEKGYKTGKKTIQIKFDQKIPTAEIKQIVKEIAKMNETKKSDKINS